MSDGLLGRLVGRFALRRERYWNYLNRNGPKMSYVMSNSGAEFLQDGVHFVLVLGGDSLIGEQMYSVLDVFGLRV